MDRRSARVALVRRLAGEPDPASRAEMDQLLMHSARWAGRLERYAAVRDAVRRLSTHDLTPEIRKACDDLLGSPAAGPIPEGPPADPTPARSAPFRLAVLLASLAGILAVLLACFFIAPGDYEPPIKLGGVVHAMGQAQLLPALGAAEQAREGAELTAGMVVSSGPDGLVKGGTAGMVFRLGAGSALRLTDSHSADLIQGLAAVSCFGKSLESVRLANNNGTVSSVGGAFLARATRHRMIVRCLRGRVQLASGDKSIQLGPGQQGMFFRGEPVEPVRTASARTLAHWEQELDALDSGRVTPAEAEFLPLAAGPPSLPDGVIVRNLAVDLVVRGPLWMAVLTCDLENTGSQAWRGRLDPARVLWPPPICAVESEEIELAPGAQAGLSCAALGTMAPGGEAVLWSLPVDGWTRKTIEGFTLSIEAAAAGGIKGAHGTDVGLRWEQSGDRLKGFLSVSDLVPYLPLLLAFRFGGDGTDDLLELPSPGRDVRHVLVASRGLVASRAAARGTERVLIVFDATADYGPLDRIFAHEIVEGIARRLSGGTWLGLVAYDGQVKNLPPARGMGMDGLLARLWALRGGEGELSEEMLFALASGPGDGSAAAFLITGAGPAAGAAAAGDLKAAPRPDSAPHVVQVGAPRPGGGYRELCASASGACTSTIGRLSPARQALRLLQAVRWPGLQEVSYAPGGGTVRYRLLTGSGEPADRPIVVALALEPQAEAVTGTLSGKAADAGFERDLSVPLGEAAPAGDDALARRLATALDEWIKAGEGP